LEKEKNAATYIGACFQKYYSETRRTEKHMAESAYSDGIHETNILTTIRDKQTLEEEAARNLVCSEMLAGGKESSLLRYWLRNYVKSLS
jgi:hypothetical protein